MTRTASSPPTPTRPGQPVWEIAELFPEQGLWTEQQYLGLSTNRLVEFDNGMIEVLPLPTKTHQLIVLFLCEALKAYITGRRAGGIVLVAPFRLRLTSGRYREPDVVYLTAAQNARTGEGYAEIAELVMEVVSADDPDRDYVTKRREYAQAGIPEYWIVDPVLSRILVLRLEAGQYVEIGTFSAGQVAASFSMTGLIVAVDDILSLGQ